MWKKGSILVLALLLLFQGMFGTGAGFYDSGRDGLHQLIRLCRWIPWIQATGMDLRIR
ncbi:hypothetical protein [Paenibacillus glucanolyticus]|uniref:hypothetical protein n=1 Tax=Paenibacillus glucanolyticus TaxID=59843 RepID=UPI001883BDF7|nr:hypothetical protein [Paenibacillus glucanolyticus]